MPDQTLFSIKVVTEDGVPIIYVQGEIDTARAGRLRDAIEPHMGPRQTITLDLSGVEFWIRRASQCWYTRGTLTADGGSLILGNPSTVAHRLLTLTGIEFVLAEYASAHPPSN